MKPLLLAVALVLPGSALACPGKDTTASDRTETEDTHADATRCAKKADLVGTACSYSTSMMAQRVDADGEAVSFTALLEKAEGTLPSKVAAPYTAKAAEGAYHVIANEVLDALDATKPHHFQGKALEVDGITYLLVTGFEPSNT